MSVFEGTIRMIGGYISAYALSEDAIFLKHAVTLADIIVPHLQANKFGIPPPSISLRQYVNTLLN
jgi:mannosyl-oligosaccharide alpha-1,2-mannosidase